jgi:capsular polysaccharide transport system permease protein
MADESRAISWNDRFAQSGLLRAMHAYVRVIGALIMRDTMSRFGRENLGFFWLMGEPLILTVGVMIVWSTTRLAHAHNVGILAFVLTGYALLTLWRHTISRSVYCFRHNAGLLFHRQIRPLDTYVARVLLESVGVGMAFYIGFLPLYLLGLVDPIADHLLLIGAWLLMTWYCFSIGLIIAAMTEMAEVIERFVQPVLYLTLPISGTFYLVEWLPEKYWAPAEYSPLINLNEMFRYGFLGDQIGTHWTVPYVIYWCVAQTAVGLLLVHKAEARIRFE